MLNEFLAKHKLGKDFEGNALKWFTPLSQQIIKHHDGANRPVFIGVNGCQGSGKSTLCDFLKWTIESQSPLNVVSLSLDDFYLSRSERLALSVKIHPLFETRGVPGTHDTALLQTVLSSLQNQTDVSIPRFDKANDDIVPQEQWEKLAQGANIVLFEGWCWGVDHQSEQLLAEPVNELEAKEDTTGVWRHFVNRQLQSSYEPVYKMMDYWVMLKAPSFSHVFKWRLEQEQKLIASSDGKATMNEAQIKRFIQYFQRLTESGLQHLPAKCDLVYELDGDRKIVNAINKAHQ